MRISDWSSDVCSSDLSGDDLLGRLQGVGAGALEDRQGDRRLAVQVAVGDVLARAELYARDILQADQPPVLARLHDYRAELAWRREAALRGHHVLEGVVAGRSEEHTSELQSLLRISYAVFCLKNKKKQTIKIHNKQ